MSCNRLWAQVSAHCLCCRGMSFYLFVLQEGVLLPVCAAGVCPPVYGPPELQSGMFPSGSSFTFLPNPLFSPWHCLGPLLFLFMIFNHFFTIMKIFTFIDLPRSHSFLGWFPWSWIILKALYPLFLMILPPWWLIALIWFCGQFSPLFTIFLLFSTFFTYSSSLFILTPKQYYWNSTSITSCHAKKTDWVCSTVSYLQIPTKIIIKVQSGFCGMNPQGQLWGT